MYGYNAATAATVVISLTEMNVLALKPLHRPNVAIKVIAELFVPAVKPGLPPLPTRYTYAGELGQV